MEFSGQPIHHAHSNKVSWNEIYFHVQNRMAEIIVLKTNAFLKRHNTRGFFPVYLWKACFVGGCGEQLSKLCVLRDGEISILMLFC